MPNIYALTIVALPEVVRMDSESRRTRGGILQPGFDPDQAGELYLMPIGRQ